ncbi:immunoglobulin kappa light chain-like isoform X2 [Pogoniulus pusillus]|uniref:immunoglobulin kappa light chain-like isoform X2 n=1 Tax=Pogoniulus pusillus TaxID=488313 RepID=UPI0030B94F68
MSFRLLGVLLLLLPGGVPEEPRSIQQSPGEVWARPGQEVKLSCRGAGYEPWASWYKEQPDGALRRLLLRSAPSPPGQRSSARMEKLGSFSLTLSPVRREDSGVYYCSFFSAVRARFGAGTRLIVTDATQPKLSILVPADSEEPGQPPAHVPLLCHLRDVPPGWHTVQWQPSGAVTAVTAVTVDNQSVPSAWSITWLPAERWDGTAACTATENGTGRSLRAAAGSAAVRLCSVPTLPNPERRPKTT